MKNDFATTFVVIATTTKSCSMDIAICHRQKFGHVWGSPVPLPEVAGKLRYWKAPLLTFVYHMDKSETFCSVTPGL